MRGRKRLRKKLLKRDFVSIGGGLLIPKCPQIRVGHAYYSLGAHEEIERYLSSDTTQSRADPAPWPKPEPVVVDITVREIAPGAFSVRVDGVRKAG